MVKETTNLRTGGAVLGAEGQGQVGTEVRSHNTDVYGSTRVPQNWELMKISHHISQGYDWWKPIREIMNNQVSDSLHRESEGTAKGSTEGTYQCLLSYMHSKRGQGVMGEICCALRKHGWTELAESFQP